MKKDSNEAVGTVRIMDGFDQSKPDSIDLIHIAECFARMGCEVVILHPVHFKSLEYATIYGPLLGTKYERKCPDLMINDNYYEYESYVRPWNKRKLTLKYQKYGSTMGTASLTYFHKKYRNPSGFLQGGAP